LSIQIEPDGQDVVGIATCAEVPGVRFQVRLAPGDRVAELTASALGDASVKAGDLRLFPLGAAVRQIRRDAANTAMRYSDELKTLDDRRGRHPNRPDLQLAVEKERVWLEERGAALRSFVDHPRPGRAGRPRRETLHLAQRYVELAAEHPDPVVQLASEMHVSPQTARNFVHRLRKDKVLTDTDPGQAGGALTPQAAKELFDGER
jgi:hypothetical protein